MYKGKTGYSSSLDTSLNKLTSERISTVRVSQSFNLSYFNITNLQGFTSVPFFGINIVLLFINNINVMKKSVVLFAISMLLIIAVKAQTAPAPKPKPAP